MSRAPRAAGRGPRRRHRLEVFGFLAAGLASAAIANPAAEETAPVLAPVLRETIGDIQAGLTELRDLEFLEPVTVSAMSEERFAEYVERRLEQEYPGDRLAREQTAYVHFGFLEPGDDLRAIFVDLVTGQAAGFYDPERKRLYLVEGRPFAYSALVHEVVHALQDQHFDLRPMLDEARDNDDRLRALQALIEGEAMALSSSYSRAHPASREQQEALADLAGPPGDAATTLERLGRFPEMLQKDLMFPYTKGMEWARRLAGRGGSALMDRLYRQPPGSTEQILHHEPDREPDLPSTFDPSCLPDLEPEGFLAVKTNTMGEFQLLELLGGESDRGAVEAAEGWDGDVYRIYSTAAGETAMAWMTVWDTAGDADEFLARVRSWLDGRPGGAAGRAKAARGGAGNRFVSVVEGFDADLSVVVDARMRAACYDAVRLR